MHVKDHASLRRRAGAAPPTLLHEQSDSYQTASPPKTAAGRRRSLSRSRAIVRDILYFARRMPLCAHERRIELASLDAIRKQSPIRISWPVIFLKAYSLVSEKNPSLRQSFVRWPWSHVYEHDETDAKLVMRRHHGGDDWLLWARFRRPHEVSLVDLQRRLERFQHAPVEEVFGQQLRLARLPLLVRRALWWWTLTLAGPRRAKRLGTFFLTTVAGQGTSIGSPPSLTTSAISYGPIDEHGRSAVTLTYDHRLLDGHHIADILAQLDEVLHAALRAELEYLSG